MSSSPHRFTFRLKVKLTLLIEGLVILVVVITGVITTLREKGTLEDELQKRGLALANDLAKFAERPLLSHDWATLRRFVNHTMKQDYVRYVSIVDTTDKVVMHSDLSQIGKSFQNVAHPGTGNFSVSDYSHAHLIKNPDVYYNICAPIEVAGARLGTVFLGYSYSAVAKEIATAQRQIILIGLVTIIIGGVVAYVLAAFISLPIQRITEAMQQVADGEISSPLTIKRHDEIGTLAESFNKMAEDLGRHRKHLEVLVEARTAALAHANEQLQQEITDRKRAEEGLKQSQEQLRDLASHLQHIREEERSRIAREIHDELGQALTALKMDVHWLGSRLSTDHQVLMDKIKAMSRIIDATVQAVRRISSELRPGLLDDLGLTAAIEWQAQEFCSRAGLHCDIRSEPEDIILDQSRSIALFRIFQEALTNIARHARATQVEVVLEENPDKVEMEIRDNGKGITAEQLAAAGSFGILGIRERVNSLGGELRISGAPAQGTVVYVSLPLEARENAGDQDTHIG
jgi:signal transduction histidine kinase|uniref:histidine kinase n=1 Tax=Desulfobacca acetoxidans TaxID=60893 RepID=A0A7V6A0N4_9BACT